MKRIYFGVLTAMMSAVSSCGIHEIGGEGGDSSSGSIWGGPVAGQSGTGVLKPVCYMTALDYQKGYDWRSDQARESVRCSLVVYADGVPIMKIPVGDAYQTSSDPDMHRIIGGHLYTDYSTDAETIIKRNGQELFRYQAREVLCGMKVIDNDVYTLGQSRDGDGFSYRKNGVVMVERKRGRVAGGLEMDCDSLCFSFSEQIKTADGEISRYYCVVGDKVSQVALREDIQKVWDVMTVGGIPAYVATLTGIRYPVVIYGEDMVAVPIPGTFPLISCSLFDAGGSPGVEIVYGNSSGTMTYSTLWVDGKILVTFPLRRTVAALGASDDGVYCAVNPLGDTQDGIIYRCGESYQMPDGYVVMGSAGMAMVNGILHVGLSSLEGRKPLVWKDGQTDSLNINGYISSFCVELPQ